MATRFYLPAAAATTPISPTQAAFWTDTSLLTRVNMDTATIADAMATTSYSDSNNGAKTILFRQHVSRAMAGGQTITGSQAVKMQIRGAMGASGANLVVHAGLRVIGSDGSTVRKTLIDNVADGVTMALGTLTNRQYTATSAATDYTTIASDYLVLETGVSGTPGGVSDHDSSLRYGDAAASDLPENDTGTTDLRPWLELTDTLSFLALDIPYVAAVFTPTNFLHFDRRFVPVPY